METEIQSDDTSADPPRLLPANKASLRKRRKYKRDKAGPGHRQPKESKEITETAPATLTNPDGSAMPPRRGKQT